MRRPVVVTGLILLTLLAGWYILTAPGLKPVVVSIYEPPIASAEKRIEDVGKVTTDSKVHRNFLLYNKGGKHLRIFDIQTTCGCTVADISKRIIAPGDFTRIKVTLDTSIKLGPVRKKVTVVSNDPKRPELALFLVGEVLPKKMQGHQQITLKPQDPLVLFKGDCATCHSALGYGKTGKALFLADCAMCHGSQGQGNHTAGPSLLTRDYDNEASLKQIRSVIAAGSSNTPQMPPFSKDKGGPLSDAQIDSLVQFLKIQALQNKMGLLKETGDSEPEDQAAFQEALKQPH